MSVIVLKNVRVVDVRKGRSLEPSDVLIEGERLKEVGIEGNVPSDANVVDLGDRYLVPGLIDAHVHVTAFTVQLGQLPQTPTSYVAAQTGKIMRGMLDRGFTTVRDAGGADYGHARALQEGLITGPRLFYSGFGLSQTGGHADFRTFTEDVVGGAGEGLPSAGLGRIADGVDAVRRAARDEIRKGAHQIKIMASGGVASPADPIHYTQYSKEEIEAAVEEAEAASTYVMAHAYTGKAIYRAVKYGVRSIEHGNLIDDQAAKLMAERDAILVPTNIIYHSLLKHGNEFGFPADSMRKLQNIIEAGLAGVTTARKAGVRVGYGTDLLGDLHPYQNEELRLRSEVESPTELLQSITMNNAELLNRSGELGELVPGAYADALVVDRDPLEDITVLCDQGKEIGAVMQGGHWIRNSIT